MWAVCRAARMSACCEGPLGAVRLLERPSWFSAAPCSSTAACACQQRATTMPVRPLFSQGAQHDCTHDGWGEVTARRGQGAQE